MTYSACPRHVVFDLMGFGDAPSLLAFADFTQTVYLTLQAVLGLETLWQWSLEMYEAVPNVSHQSATGKGVIRVSSSLSDS
jgi:hypothetical protein